MLNPEYADWVAPENMEVRPHDTSANDILQIGFTDDVPDEVLTIRLTMRDAIDLKNMLVRSIRTKRKEMGQHWPY